MGERKVLSQRIAECDQVINSNDMVYAKKLQEKILSVFSNIPGIVDGLSTYESAIEIDYLGDIEKLRDKLRIYSSQISNKSENAGKPSKIVFNNNNNSINTNTNTNNLDISLIFQHARKQIEEDGSLSEQEINEILNKITELEEINNTQEPKNKKWFKMRPTMEWLGTKGLTTATCILNLITSILISGKYIFYIYN